ncbi:BOS complex subunit NOMO3-like [Paramacrobiotus metropolitanus]|uniref:BOS complex subunit NOMO3-like n=1 Tax=Paramacrobiotus metropolitanus TaxID=2943436 RepID=UPI002445A788|nr:BOS complex subunit NOMO3-like [Paramacrobiotus metropolitanus]
MTWVNIPFSVPWFCWAVAQLMTCVRTNEYGNGNPVICGGFVQSDFPMDYSKIEVRLLDKAGNLKYQAPCAVNNGNYEVPVFGKKGEFILAVAGPEGLSFEPSRIPVNIDGTTDPCSMQQNLNFRFIGYSLVGKVNSISSADGPAGVTISVLDQTGKAVSTTTTQSGGDFALPNLLPGTYTIRASHPVFRLHKSESTATLKDSTLQLPQNSLVVRGYPVKGSVKSSGEPVAGVKFLLYSKTIDAKGIDGCDKEMASDLAKDHPQYGRQLCGVKSDKLGEFIFASLVPGIYSILPTYKGGDTKYDIEPSHMEVQLGQDLFTISNTFEIKGFTATGSVFTSSKGSGVPSAEIYLNGTLAAKTDTKGIYRLEKTVTGWYKIEVKKSHYDFPTSYVKITPTEPKVPMIVARGMSVCGEIKTLRPVNRILTFEAVEAKTGISRDTVIRDDHFCTTLEAGEYKLSIFDAPQDKSQRLMFSPAEKIIKLTDYPITDLLFSQVLGSVSGTVHCLSTCPSDLKVALLASNGEVFSLIDNDGKFKFNNVDLGTHLVKVVEPSKRYCWDLIQKTIELTVGKPSAIVGFRQTGFLFEIWSSHPTAIAYSVKGKQARKEDNLKAGFTELCLPDAGEYDIEPKSCHKFEHDTYTFNTDSPVRLSLHATGHLTNISVNTDDDKGLFKLRVKRTSDGSSSIFTPSAPPKLISPETFQYSFLEYFPAEENLVLFPSSETLLFKPNQMELAVTDQCDKNVIVLNGNKGVIITGGTLPPVPDVDITITTENDVLRGKTDESGRYSLGPVPRTAIKSIAAEKRGYEFEWNSSSHDLKAIKLSEIRVHTNDAEGKPVAGVLVSISNSAGSRFNNFTDQTGVVSFINIGLGDYLIRPMVKEFRFDPASKSVTLTEGQTASVEWRGIRVAYSAFGIVTSLGGEPEQGITMEAVSREPCLQMQEEAITGSTGHFRISGLKAGCGYEVRPKEGELERLDIKWTAPANRVVQMGTDDTHGLTFRTLRGFNEAEFTGRLDATKEFLNQLKVCLYRADRPDESVQCVSFSISPLFQFSPVPLDNRNYIIRVESSLSQKDYVFTSPDLHVTANSTFRHFVLSFTARRRLSEPEITPATMWIVPLVIVCTIAYFNRSNILPTFHKVVSIITKTAVKSTAGKDRKKPQRSTSPLPQGAGDGSFEDYLAGGPIGVKKRTKAAKS